MTLPSAPYTRAQPFARTRNRAAWPLRKRAACAASSSARGRSPSSAGERQQHASRSGVSARERVERARRPSTRKRPDAVRRSAARCAPHPAPRRCPRPARACRCPCCSEPAARASGSFERDAVRARGSYPARLARRPLALRARARRAARPSCLSAEYIGGTCSISPGSAPAPAPTCRSSGDRTRALEITSPSASPVVVVSPSLSVARYSLSASSSGPANLVASPKQHRQQPGGERVERAGVAGLFRAEQALALPAARRSELRPTRLVEQQHAVDHRLAARSASRWLRRVDRGA